MMPRAGATVTHVTIDDPPRMSLLGLILGSILTRNLDDPRRQRVAARLRGEIVVQAGEMVVTLSCRGDEVRICRGASDRPRAAIRGELHTLIDLALGGGMIGPVLAGRLRPRGSLSTLLRLRSLLRVGPA
jgi:hypothetical protein